VGIGIPDPDSGSRQSDIGAAMASINPTSTPLQRRSQGHLWRRYIRAVPTPIPPGLIDAIQGGSCVAFVGAGFSAAAGLPRWSKLLRDAAAEAPAPVRDYVDVQLGLETAHAFDEAAQVLEDELGRERFLKVLQAGLGQPALTVRMEQRLRWLRGIPFRAVLTLNFDGVMPGELPSGEAYRSVLRPDSDSFRWWEPVFWGENPRGAPVLQLHGRVDRPETVVFTRRGYRQRLYSDPAYMAFLRAVLAQQTVLYLGFSFADAYLNELRSESLALLDHSAQSRPVAYAVINDVAELGALHYRRNEGVEMLSYDSKNSTDFSAFDDFLRALHESTNPELRLGRQLAGKRFLWVDPSELNNDVYVSLFERLSRLGSTPVVIEGAPTASGGLRALETARIDGRPFDLVISNWTDHVGGGRPNALVLLEGMRRQDLRAPVLVFAGDHDVESRKRQVLALGGQAYTFTTGGLLRAVDTIFAPARQTG